MQLQAGTHLQGGKYKIERVLGQGGFGITYLATQELLDRRVCIKEFFFKEYCERDEVTSHVSLGTQSNHEIVERFMNKFLKEARTISQLDHPNIIHIHDIFKENGTAYYVMDFIEGESLSDKVNHNGALSESEAVDYIKQVASALDFIHQRSINHLDVKPANIMVRQSDNKAILIDFGLSKQYDNYGNQTSTTPVGISHGYAPMEQYNQGGVSTFSPQTDIYSLGATLYKLVTGTTPPQAIEVFNDGLTGIPQSLSPNLVEAIRKTMQPKRADRPQSIGEFMVLLDGEYTTSASSAKAQCEIDESTRVIGASSCEPIKKPSSSPQPTINKVEETKGKNGMIKFGVVIGIVVVCFITLFLSDIGNNDKHPHTSSAPQQLALIGNPNPQPQKQTQQPQPSSSSVTTTATTGKINGHEWVDLGLSVKWATCNVGASSPSDYGSYYAWGETNTKSECYQYTYKYYNNSTYDYINIGSDISGTEFDVARINWGGTWRMPNLSEFKELKSKCSWNWTTQDGLNGYRVTGPNGNSIFLIAAGHRAGTDFFNRGSKGFYWSAELYLGYDSASSACCLSLNNGYYDWEFTSRELCGSIRPVTE